MNHVSTVKHKRYGGLRHKKYWTKLLVFLQPKEKKILYFGAYYLLLDLTSNYSDVFTSAAVACKRARSSFSLPMNHSSHGERLSFKGDWFLTPAISESSAFLN